MSPEELNRTIEFIIQSQARLAAAQEQDRQERVTFEKWSKGLTQSVVALIETQSRSLELQSRRLDEYEKEQREQRVERRASEQAAERAAEKRHEEVLKLLRETRDWQQAFQMDAQKRHEEALARLASILEKLTDRMN
jgi:hypothetical protein